MWSRGAGRDSDAVIMLTVIEAYFLFSRNKNKDGIDRNSNKSQSRYR